MSGRLNLNDKDIFKIFSNKLNDIVDTLNDLYDVDLDVKIIIRTDGMISIAHGRLDKLKIIKTVYYEDFTENTLQHQIEEFFRKELGKDLLTKITFAIYKENALNKLDFESIKEIYRSLGLGE